MDVVTYFSKSEFLCTKLSLDVGYACFVTVFWWCQKPDILTTSTGGTMRHGSQPKRNPEATDRFKHKEVSSLCVQLTVYSCSKWSYGWYVPQEQSVGRGLTESSLEFQLP